MTGVKPHEDFSFFCDESGVSNDRFTVVGGVCVSSKSIEGIHKNMCEYRELLNMKAELKWTKISRGKLEEYIKLVDYFFAMNNINTMQFHSLIFDNHQWKNGQYNDGDRDKGLSKLYYQLIHHRFSRICAAHGSLYVCLDHRNSSTSLHDLRSMLNSSCKRSYGIDTNPVKQVVSADSKKEIMLQINDVILGAVSAVRNGKHLLASSSPAKRAIAERVLEKTGLASFETCTPRHVTRFTVWNFKAR